MPCPITLYFVPYKHNVIWSASDGSWWLERYSHRKILGRAYPVVEAEGIYEPEPQSINRKNTLFLYKASLLQMKSWQVCDLRVLFWKVHCFRFSTVCHNWTANRQGCILESCISKKNAGMEVLLISPTVLSVRNQQMTWMKRNFNGDRMTKAAEVGQPPPPENWKQKVEVGDNPTIMQDSSVTKYKKT